MKKLVSLVFGLAACLGLTSISAAQTWTRVQGSPNIGSSAPILMHDGTVLIHDADAPDWWKLTPDSHGNYATGTWSQIASTPSTYGPQYFGSAVLKDGSLVVIGGEYNLTNQEVWTNIGYIYVDRTNSWIPLSAPTGWDQIGDAQSVVLNDGTFMLGNFQNTQAATLNESNLTWTEVGSGKVDRCDEEGWTLLPDGTVFTVDDEAEPGAQRYLPTTGQWISAGTVPVLLPQPNTEELGPQLEMYDGRIFCVGATGNNAIYTPPASLNGTGSWTVAPAFPIEPVSGLPYDVADGPGCVLPNGDLLIFASPGFGMTPSAFFLYDGSNLTMVPGTPNTPTDSSFYGNMLLLPNGQMLFTDFSNDIELYTPAGGPKDVWRPTLTSVPSKMVAGKPFVFTGTQLNGFTPGSAYGDDFQNATNYPMARFTNLVTGNVVYGRTGGYSSMALGTGTTPIQSNVLLPANIDSGPNSFEVITNGIASASTVVYVDGVNQYSLESVSVAASNLIGGQGTTGNVNFYDTAQKSANIIFQSNSAAVQVPSGLVCSAGQTQVPFNLGTNPVAGTVNATLTATCNGVTVSTVVTVRTIGVSSLKLSLPSTVPAETVTGTITLSQSAPSPGVTVSLSSSNTGVISVPASATVATGATTGTFTFAAKSVGASTPVTITASTASGSASATMRVIPSILTSVMSSSSTVQMTGTATMTVTLDGPAPPSTGAVVSLGSSSAALSVPTKITISANATKGTFSATAAVVSVSTPVTVTATYMGVSKTVSVTVSATAVPKSISFASNPVICGTTDTGTVTLEGEAPSGGGKITIASATPSVLASSTFTIAAGQASGSYNFSGNAVSANTTVTITVSAAGGSFKTSIIIAPGLLSGLTLGAPSVQGGVNTSASVSFQGLTPSTGAAISLKSSDSSVKVPATVTIPYGLKMASFGLQTFQVSGNKTVTITATYQGVSRTATVTLMTP